MRAWARHIGPSQVPAERECSQSEYDRPDFSDYLSPAGEAAP